MDTKVRTALEAIAAGRMVILVDDEGRENEGDFVLSADRVTPESINFMATYGRGLICLAMDGELIDKLELPMMVRDNEASLGTAFTVSIEARHGVTTGISAKDRAATIQAAVNPDARPYDIVSPGHIFPLRARDGGVLVRTGQTEGSVDLARLAGLAPAGVICEIMRPDGEMARMPELEQISKEHNIPLLSVADLVSYRLRTERIVKCEREANMRPASLGPGQPWQVKLYTTPVEDTEYVALIKGDVAAASDAGQTLDVRVQSFSPLADGLGTKDLVGPCLRHIENTGVGVFLYVVNRDRLSMSDSFDREILGKVPERKAGNRSETLRDYGLGAQVLADIGCKDIRLMTNSDRRLAGIEGFGINIKGRLSIDSVAAIPDIKPERVGEQK